MNKEDEMIVNYLPINTKEMMNGFLLVKNYKRLILSEGSHLFLDENANIIT